MCFRIEVCLFIYLFIYLFTNTSDIQPSIIIVNELPDQLVSLLEPYRD